ncbi:hypothetical protein AgCh_029372 [Apium graveolens]
MGWINVEVEEGRASENASQERRARPIAFTLYESRLRQLLTMKSYNGDWASLIWILNFEFHKFESSKTFSICISGIIGLTIAHKFLLESDLSVAIVDAVVPCAGATSAHASNVTELVSRRDDAVTFLQMQPIPAKCDGCERFMDLHPLLLVVASEEIRCSDPVQHGMDSSLRDKYEPRV